jgi:hypothetical protein
MESIHTKAIERSEPGGLGGYPLGELVFHPSEQRERKQSYASCFCLCMDPLVRVLYSDVHLP